jgi:hypothetical protein
VYCPRNSRSRHKQVRSALATREASIYVPECELRILSPGIPNSERPLPASPVLQAAAGVVTQAAEKHAAHAAGDGVVPGRVLEGDEGGARMRHAGLLPWNRVAQEVNAAAVAVQGKWMSRSSRPNEYTVPGIPGIPEVFLDQRFLQSVNSPLRSTGRRTRSGGRLRPFPIPRRQDHNHGYPQI